MIEFQDAGAYDRNAASAEVYKAMQLAAHLYGQWGTDAALFIGGMIFDCKRSHDPEGKFLWESTLIALTEILTDDAPDEICNADDEQRESAPAIH